MSHMNSTHTVYRLSNVVIHFRVFGATRSVVGLHDILISNTGVATVQIDQHTFPVEYKSNKWVILANQSIPTQDCSFED